MVCHNCGNEISDNTTICTVCGEPFTDSQEYYQYLYYTRQNSYGKIALTLFVVIFAIILVLINVSIFLGNTNNTPDFPVASPTEVSVITEMPTEEPKTILYITNCSDFINLRIEPSVTSQKLGTIPYGTPVELIEKTSTEFYKIIYNQKIGYASTQFLSETNPPNPTVSPTLQIVNCNPWVFLRAEPSTDSRKLSRLTLGENVEFLETSTNGFYKVKYKNITGYIMSDYLA